LISQCRRGGGRFIIQEKVVKNTIWNSIGVLIYFACQYMITIVVVRLYDGYMNAGYLALAMNITNFFSAVAIYNVRVFQVSDIKGEYNDSEYVIARILTCASSILLCFIFVIVAERTAMEIIIVLCYMVFRANESFIDVLHGINQKHWRMDYIGVSLAVRGVLMLAAFVLLGWLFGLLPAIIGMAVITIIIGIVYDVQKTKKLAIYTAYAGKQILSLLKRCFPLMLVILIGTIIVSYSRYSVERIHGTEALGIYASVSVPTMMVQIAISLLFAPLANLFSEALKAGDKSKFCKIFAIASAIIAGITFAFFLASHILGEWGLNILYGASIVPYTYLLPGTAIVAGLTGTMWFMNLVFAVIRDIKGILAGTFIGVIICFATTDMFLNNYGLIGANHVMIISQGAATLCLLARLFWVIKRKQGLFVKTV